MKVLSIKEPYATLIKNKDKYIETRSWKTKYRGELYIHASGKGLTKEYNNNSYINKLIKDKKINNGHIICKVNLIDCKYMDKEFLKEIKKNPKEYNLGLYAEGRYAWIFDNITTITPIPAKGKLNIWTYNK